MVVREDSYVRYRVLFDRSVQFGGDDELFSRNTSKFSLCVPIPKKHTNERCGLRGMLYVVYDTVSYCSRRHSDAAAGAAGAAGAAACWCCCRVAGGRIETTHPLILLSS